MDSKDIERVVIDWARKRFGSDSSIDFSRIWKQDNIWEITGEVHLKYFWGLRTKIKNFRVQIDNQASIVGYDL